MLGLESMTGALEDFGVEDFLQGNNIIPTGIYLLADVRILFLSGILDFYSCVDVFL